MTNTSITGKLILVVILLIFIAPGFGFVSRGPDSSKFMAPPIPAATTPGPAIVTFDAASIQKTAPAEAIQSIDLRLGGGGYPGCLDTPEEPTLDYKNDNLELSA